MSGGAAKSPLTEARQIPRVEPELLTHDLLADALADLGHDAVSTNRLSKKGARDPAQLITAADLRRILVTHNEADFFFHESW